MRDRSEIWQLMLADAGIRCSVRTARDLDTVTRRVKNEGEAFFTKVLPTFARDLERSLDEGIIHSGLFYGFTRKKATVSVTPDDCTSIGWTQEVSGGVPMFLSGFMEIIFDSHWDVTQREFQDIANICVVQPRVMHSPFPPRIRNPKDAEEEGKMADAIHCVRQLALLFSKEWALPDEDLIRTACENYVTTDKELADPFMTGE